MLFQIETMAFSTHGRKSARILLCYSANVPFSEVITEKQLIKVHKDYCNI